MKNIAGIFVLVAGGAMIGAVAGLVLTAAFVPAATATALAVGIGSGAILGGLAGYRVAQVGMKYDP